MKKLLLSTAFAFGLAISATAFTSVVAPQTAQARPCGMAIGSGKTFCLQKWQTRNRFGEVGRHRQHRMPTRSR
jgi:hypothetical protein